MKKKIMVFVLWFLGGTVVGYFLMTVLSYFGVIN